MNSEPVVVFRPYPFKPGDRIHIEAGPRKGDWGVVEVTDRKIRLQCPISRREVEWNQFCYFVEKCENKEWPCSEMADEA